MTTQLLAVLYSLGTLFGWGLENGLSKKYSRSLGPSKLIVYRNLVTVIITATALALFWEQSHFNLQYILLGFFLAIVGYIGYYFFLKGLETGNLGLVSPVSSSRILIATLVGITLLKDTIEPIQIYFVIIIFLGVALSSVDFRDIKKSDLFNVKSGILYALLNALIWGIVFPFYSILSAILGAFVFALILETTGLTLSLVQAKATHKPISLTEEELRGNKIGLFLVGLSGGLGTICVTLGYSTGHIGIVSAISGAVPLVAVTYGRIVYKESLSRLQYIAIALMAVGIVCLAYLSG